MTIIKIALFLIAALAVIVPVMRRVLRSIREQTDLQAWYDEMEQAPEPPEPSPVFGLSFPKRLMGFPPGEVSISLSDGNFAVVTIKLKDGTTEKWFTQETESGDWIPYHKLNDYSNRQKRKG